jgi:hypothetical protein
MRVGDLVRFKMNEYQTDWMVGLLLRYDKFMKVGEILCGDHVYYSPGRLIETAQRGKK